jgi:hypothetical protein
VKASDGSLPVNDQTTPKRWKLRIVHGHYLLVLEGKNSTFELGGGVRGEDGGSDTEVFEF